MMMAFLLVLLGTIPMLAIVAARRLEAMSWRRSLVAYRLQPSSKLTAEQVGSWLGHIAAITHPTRLALLPLPPVCVEVSSTAAGIAIYVLVTKGNEARILAGIQATMPGTAVIEAADYLNERPAFNVAGEARITNLRRPLADVRAEVTNAALISSLQPVSGDAVIRMQWIVTSGGTPRPVSTPNAVANASPAWMWENASPHDAEAVKAARLKSREPHLLAVARIGVAAPSSAQAHALFGRVWSNLHGLNNPGVQLVRRWLPTTTVAQRLTERAVPLIHWPVLLRTSEAAGLVGLPVSGLVLPGMAPSPARQLPPGPQVPSGGNVLGVSNYLGLTNRRIGLRPNDRLRHMSVIAPTGAGKSWLLARMALQDIKAGFGTVVIDPKGDLITDILGRIDPADTDRVVMIDASQRNQPIGLNILGGAHDETSRELLADNVLGVFRSIWSDFWGPRSDSLCRAALNTLVHARGVDGSALTLCELVPLLTEPSFRRFVVRQAGVPDTARAYWQRFEALSEGERQQVINPLLHKVEAFTSRTPIRLMLGQTTGFDFRDVFTKRKVVLVSLAKGSIGTETANLLGSLLVMLLWQATLSRTAVPQEARRPVFAYIDEAPDLMRLPVPLSEMLSQARGLGLGITLATQFIDQVPQAIRTALLGTVRSQLVFAVERDDATALASRFAPLSADELQGLQPYEAALRPCVNGVTVSPVTLTTLPLEKPLRDASELAAHSRDRHGMERTAVEAGLRARTAATGSTSPVGRRIRGGGS
ncbi:hypothetical protein Lesp02_29810 [Lentzea sp. NBRC 105346]|uniref:type IV secretory system conjugative DNA transfer family protein n=1 Tax=Lentzea sp. NBRC 105346 TaxID=3032205 RepID=UPI00249FC428|nr:type IV secretion system DNA-binding domain-containing protein [Lentzea sp. NBRC 105346]GLZ30792.1 hypothetical protein Lesp02_29810 [Lentzea sp. NBRC 105346]